MDFDLTSIFGGPMGMSLFGGPGGPILGKPSGAGSLFGDLPVPGMPATGGKQLGLLKAGDDDMQPPPMPNAATGLLKAGREDAPGPPRSLLAESPANMPAVGAQTVGGEGGGAFVIPSTGQSIPAGSPAATTPVPAAAPPPGPIEKIMTPPLATPAGTGRVPDPDRFVAPRVPNSGGGPDERVAAPAPIVPPKIDTSLPHAGGGTITGAPAPVADPATTGTTAPATVPGAGEAAPAGGMDKFREWLGKTGSISGTKTPPPQGRSPGSAGAPHRPSGGAELLNSILAAHAKAMPRPAPIGQLPPGLLRRFQGA